MFVASTAAAAQVGELIVEDRPDPATLPGAWIERDDGSFMRFYVEENNFHLEFYNAGKEPVAPDAIRAIIRYRRPMRAIESITLNLSDDGALLSNPIFIRPPFNFHVIIVLIFGEAGRTESHDVRLNQAVEPSRDRR